MSNRNEKLAIEIGTGSVFAQLGLPNPEDRLRKARLMSVINDVIKRRGLSQSDVAKLAGLDQADISRIMHGRGARYSTDRLLNVLARLGVDVELIQRRGENGDLVVEVHELARA
ncbi:MAG: helix-turn-helix domain-containing protein [Vulcanimicrobiaceae bacterium]